MMRSILAATRRVAGRRCLLAQAVAAVSLALATPMAQTPTGDGAPGTIVVGSKNFTESCILGEVIAQLLEARTSLQVERRIHLGGTQICQSALLSGEIDIYAEYTGTGWAIVLQEAGRITDPLRAYFHVSRRYVEEFDVHWLQPFGLENSYALAIDRETAERRGITRISDLLPIADELRAGFSIEFMEREDGYPGLSAAYGLRFSDARAIEHGLAYQAIRAGQVDVIDAYTTDGKLLRYSLRVLQDDRQFFPPYHAAPIVRGAVLRAHPEVETVLADLAFRLPDELMQVLNDAVEAEGASFAGAARAYLESEGLVEGASENARVARESIERLRRGEAPEASRAAGRRARTGFFATFVDRLGITLRLTIEHLGLTFSAVFLAAFLAIPLGVWGASRPRVGQLALACAGVLQTIPSLALLALMIPVLGLGVGAAIVALLLYALLPILRNTITGIAGVDAILIDAARGIGMREREILRRVQLPLALPTIFAGVRTSAVIGVGVATLAAFISAGGLGQPILIGLYLDDTDLILCGAVPAALLAVATDFVLGRVERRLAPQTSASTAPSVPTMVG